MNLFWKKAFGSLKTTEKLEKEEADLLLDYKRYCNIEVSEELKEYTRLFHIVKSADFKEKKKTLQNRKFKDTEEYRDWKKYQKLHHSSDLKHYYQVLGTKELADFLAFKVTEEYEQLGNKKVWKKDERLKAFKAYQMGKDYKIYVRFHNSYVVSEYEKLKKHVAEESFIKNKAYWEDEQRWLKTEEHQIEQNFLLLQKQPDIQFYESTDPKRFAGINDWKITFEDNFNENSLDIKKWQSGYYHRASKLKRIYSFANEKQSYTDSKNLIFTGSDLKINTIPGKNESLAWDSKKGFVNKEFDFSSGIINTGEAFQQKYGLIKAKLRVSGSSDISHAFWLGTDGKLPHINVFLFNGKSIVVNNYAKEGSNVVTVKETIKGISIHDYYIYSLEWTPKELIWKINNLEVFRTSKNVPNESMFPVFSSFISEAQKGGSGSLEVDWIKIYSK